MDTENSEKWWESSSVVQVKGRVYLELSGGTWQAFRGGVMIPIVAGTRVVREMPGKTTLVLYYGGPW